MGLAPATRSVLLDPRATRPGQLTLANVINDASRVAASADGFGRDGAYAGMARTGIWPSQTNQILNSDALTDTTNIGGNGGGTVSRETTASKCPLGATSTKVICAGALSDEGAFFRPTAGSAAAADVWSGRAFVYHETGSAINIVCRITWRDAANAAISDTDGVTVSVPSGVKTEVTVLAKTAPALTDRAMIKVIKTDVSAATVWIGGVMAVKSAVLGPSIATDGAAASSSAGRVQMPWDAGLFTATQGWAAVRLRYGWAATPIANATAFSWAISANERIELVYVTNQWVALKRTGGAGTSAAAAVHVPAVGDYETIIISWTATTVNISEAGAVPVSASNSSVPVGLPVTVDFGSSSQAATREQGCDDLWVTVGNGLITAGAAAAINAFGNTKPTIRSLDQVARGAHAMAVWSGRDGTFQRRIAS